MLGEQRGNVLPARLATSPPPQRKNRRRAAVERRVSKQCRPRCNNSCPFDIVVALVRLLDLLLLLPATIVVQPQASCCAATAGSLSSPSSSTSGCGGRSVAAAGVVVLFPSLVPASPPRPLQNIGPLPAPVLPVVPSPHRAPSPSRRRCPLTPLFVTSPQQPLRLQLNATAAPAASPPSTRSPSCNAQLAIVSPCAAAASGLSVARDFPREQSGRGGGGLCPVRTIQKVDAKPDTHPDE